jgi:hypothetical protein
MYTGKRLSVGLLGTNSLKALSELSAEAGFFYAGGSASLHRLKREPRAEIDLRCPRILRVQLFRSITMDAFNRKRARRRVLVDAIRADVGALANPHCTKVPFSTNTIFAIIPSD